MNLATSTEQSEIAATARRWLRQHPAAPPPRSSERGASAPDEGAWREIAAMGWLSLAAHTTIGGLDLGAAEEVMVFREIGRGLASGPLLPTVVAIHAATRAGATELAGELARGERRAGLALGGRAIDARPGDLVLTLAERETGLAELGSAETVPSLDPLTSVVRIVDSTPVLTVATEELGIRARLLIAAQLLGIIEAVRDASVEYALTRTQFGRPIGSFQAVKHRCAEMEIAAYAGASQVFAAAVQFDAKTPDAAFETASAFLLTSRLARKCATDNIQNHGGIGFTWEHPAHLYLKRATLLSAALERPREVHAAVIEGARMQARR